MAHSVKNLCATKQYRSAYIAHLRLLLSEPKVGSGNLDMNYNQVAVNSRWYMVGRWY